MNFPRVGVGVIVTDSNKKILLGKRKGSYGAGTWGLPGGHLEFFEEVERCAVRELLEETGLKALKVKRGPWTNAFIEKKHYVTVFVLVTLFEGKIELKEPEKCEGWAWFDLDRLPTPLFGPAIEIVDWVKQSLEPKKLTLL